MTTSVSFTVDKRDGIAYAYADALAAVAEEFGLPESEAMSTLIADAVDLLTKGTS